MIQIAMLVVGIYYAYRLMNLSSAGLNYGMHPEALVQWRAHKKTQYLWGIAAGWGSLVLGLGALFAVTAMTRQCVTFVNYCYSDTGAAFGWSLIVTVLVLGVGIALSVQANNRAKALERTGMNPYGAQTMQPGWGQPPVQPGWGQPPVQPGWGQPPVQPGWGQPPAQPGWGQPAAPQPPAWGQPPAPPAPPAWGAPAASPAAAPADGTVAPIQPDVSPTDPPVA
jgi:uncharacterized membrane protein